MSRITLTVRKGREEEEGKEKRVREERGGERRGERRVKRTWFNFKFS